MGKEKMVVVMKGSVTKRIPESKKKSYTLNGWIELKDTSLNSYDSLHSKYNK